MTTWSNDPSTLSLADGTTAASATDGAPDPFTPAVSGGGSVTFRTSEVIGVKHWKFDGTTTAGIARGDRTVNTATLTTCVRGYIDGLAADQYPIGHFRTSQPALGLKLIIKTDGSVDLTDDGGTVLSTVAPVGAVTAGSHFRFALATGIGTTTTNGTIRAELYLGANADGTTPNYTYAATNVNASTVNYTTARFGKLPTSLGTIRVLGWRGSDTQADFTAGISAPFRVAVVGTPTLGEVASAQSVTCNVPTGVLAGELLVVAVTHSEASAAVPDQTGWTTVAKATNASASVQTALFYRVATGSEPASYTFTGLNASAVNRATAEMFRLSGVDTTTPLDVAAGTAVGFGTSITTPSVTTVTAGALVIYAVARATATASDINVASGTTLIIDTTGTGRRAITAQEARPTVGATGTRSWTSTDATSLGMAGIAAAFRPATGAAADTTAPSVPTSVTATAGGPTSVTVAWTASTDAVGVTSYRVRRNGVDLTGATAVTGTSFTDTTTTGGTTYSYTVSAVDAAGNRSAESSTATVTTPLPPDTTAPTVPTSVTAVAASPTTVTVSWTASTDAVGVASYRVRRDGVDLAGAVGGTSYVDATVVASTGYSYTVSAVDAAGNRSAESTAATVVTPAPIVIVPSPTPPGPGEWSAFSRQSDYSIGMALPISAATVVVPHLGLGKAVFSTSYTTDVWTALQPGNGLELYRSGVQTFSGPVTSRSLTWDEESGAATIRVEAVSDAIVFAQRLVHPDPSRASDAQTINDYWTFTGKGSAALRKLITDQAGVDCHLSRKVTGLVLAGSDPNVGASKTWTALFDNVLDLMAAISASSGVDLGLRMTTSTGALSANVVVPTDRSGTVIFSADLSNVGSTTFTESAPKATHALVAGSGDLHLRTRRLVVTTDTGNLRWGQQGWVYVDRRDTAVLTTLDQAGADALVQGKGTVSLTIGLLSNEAGRYGTDWNLGDKVTAYVGLPDQPKVAVVNDAIRELTFTVNEDGTERIQAAIGSVDARTYLPTPTQRAITAAARDAAALIRNK